MNQLNSKMKFEELLTPYVQNRLKDTERQYVEELAKADSELNEKLQFEIKLANSIQQSSNELKDVAPSFDKLKKRIETTSNKNWLNVFAWNNRETMGGFNQGLVFASLAVIFVAAYMLLTQGMDNQLQNDYETLSTDESVIIQKDDRQYLRIVVAQEITESQVQSLSNEFIFDIESGPDSLNSYVISLAKRNALSENELKNWRNDSRFLFIEPLPSASTEN